LLPIAVVLAAIGVFVVLVTLPPHPVVLTGAKPPLLERTVRGAVHVHTQRSDGLGDKAAIAAAARRAGLQFVVLTDHGDGMRPSDPPVYVDSVLCLDAAEISTDDGHYVAIGASASPYPLGGSAAAVVDDVQRLGGFGIAAHPTSMRRDLQWTDWAAPIDALEWINTDSEWRDETRFQLAVSLAPYLFRPGGAVSRILDRPQAALSRWDDLARRRRVLAIAGNDAHGGVGNRVEDQSRRWSIPIPSYEASFRTFSTNVRLRQPLTGDGARDAAAIVEALKAGRFYTELDALATGSALEFAARTVGAAAEQGSVLPGSGPAAFHAEALLPPDAVMVAYANGEAIAKSRTSPLDFTSERAGAHRIEVHVRNAPGEPPVPWLVSNPIFRLASTPEPPSPRPSVVHALNPSWRIEKDAGSQASVQSDEAGGATFTYKLREGARVSQFAALVADLSNPPPFDALTFSARSSAPRRVSVQLRFARDDQARWGKSVYVDSTRREITVAVEQLRRADGPAARPAAERATSLLFVVDLTNARPADSATIEVGGVELTSK
jgi:hypothetical protein